MQFWHFTAKLGYLILADDLYRWPMLVRTKFNACLFSCVFYRVNELYVDDPDKDSGGKIDVSLNISLPNLHCDCEYIHKIHKYSSE